MKTSSDLQHDRGAVIILVAFAMTVIMIIAAMVIDLGHLRSVRRADQSAVDLASLAAGAYLSGQASTGGSVSSDPRGACTAALNSIRANVADFPAAATLDCNIFPTTAAACALPMRTATAVGAAPYQLSIHYPVPNSEISDGRFAGGAGDQDGDEPCERMQVTLTTTNEPFFAGVMGVEAMEVSARSTVRASIGQGVNGSAALLLLERVGCEVISANAPSGGGIRILPSNESTAGVIQVDSAGTVGVTGGCTTNSNAGGFVAWGTRLSSSPNDPSIYALPAPNGNPGTVGLRSLAVGGRGASPVPDGVFPVPVPSQVMSRQPVDDKYNRPTSEAGGVAQITNLHADAYHLATKAPHNPSIHRSWLLANGWTIYDQCTGGVFAGQKVFINCPGGFSAASNSMGGTRFPDARDVVFNGKVDVSNGSTLAIPNPRRVYIRGCQGGSCGGGNYFAIRVAGTLRINTGGDGTTAATCESRRTSTNVTEIATFDGPLRATGTVSLCQTFVYLGQNQSTYTRRTQTTNLIAPENYPTIAGCSPALPCPTNANTGSGYFSLSGGGSNIDWTAPNQLDRQPEAADFLQHPFEDLALWTESSETSIIGGQGTSQTTGVFFAPNATVDFSGQASQNQPRNAQFISRRLWLSGQGTLVLRPDPADSVLTPVPGGWSLIR